MTLRSLQALRALMETGTVTQAAARLALTQPQVSRLIGGLEEDLGFKLFTRHRRRLLPTAEGTTFYREVERILVGFDEIGNVVRDIHLKTGLRLRLLAQPHIAHGLLPEVLAAFCKTHPELRYSLEIRPRRDVQQWMAGRQFDLGLAVAPVEDPAVRCVPFASVRVVAALPPGHRLATRTHVAPRDVVGDRLIGLRPYTLLRDRLARQFEHARVALNIRGETSTGLSACQMVVKGLGVTIVDPFTALSFQPGQLTIRPWRPPLELTYSFLYPTDVVSSPFVERFADTVCRTAERLAPEHVRLLPRATGRAAP